MMKLDMAGMQVIYKTSISKNDQGTRGKLEIMEGMLLFKPNDPNSDSKIVVKTQNIKSKKCRKEVSNHPPLLNLTDKQGRSHIFQFENYPEMHACLDFINMDLAKCEEEPKKLSIEDLELRFKLLQENSELQRLHKQFVGGKILTDNEFWATRKELLYKDSIRKWKQQVGLKNMMISGTKPSTDGQTNKVTFT